VPNSHPTTKVTVTFSKMYYYKFYKTHIISGFKKRYLGPTFAGAAATGEAPSMPATKKLTSKEMCEAKKHAREEQTLHLFIEACIYLFFEVFMISIFTYVRIVNKRCHKYCTVRCTVVYITPI